MFYYLFMCAASPFIFMTDPAILQNPEVSKNQDAYRITKSWYISWNHKDYLVFPSADIYHPEYIYVISYHKESGSAFVCFREYSFASSRNTFTWRTAVVPISQLKYNTTKVRMP